METLCRHAEQIFLAGLKSVLPKQMINSKLRLDRNLLTVGDKSFNLHKNLYVVGFGKAVLGMARAVEDLLGQHLVRGIITVPTGIQEAFRSSGNMDMLLVPDSKIKVYEGAKNNIPDTDAAFGANQIVSLTKELKENDILMVLISGGGSALLPVPVPAITLAEKIQVIEKLSKSGATIQELNTVRQHLSLVKGGGLAKLANSAKVLSLILSDVVGDPLEFIASGPTVRPTNKNNALLVFEKYNMENQVPKGILSALKNKTHDSVDELNHVTNIVLGNNSLAVQAAQHRAQQLGYSCFPLCNSIQGESKLFGQFLAELAFWAINNFLPHLIPKTNAYFNIPLNKLQELVLSKGSGNPLCIITAGETIVKVTGKGVGGRNQEMSLAACIQMKRLFTSDSGAYVVVLSAGTDGFDGPTSAAGAIAYNGLYDDALQQELNPEEYLENNDSNLFFRLVNSGKNLVLTNHTGTNVMDIQVMLISPK